MNKELESLALAEAERLRACLEGLNPLLERLIDAAAVAHARRILADRAWSEEGGRPDSPWLRASRDALRDYQAALRLLLKHAETPAPDPLQTLW